MQSETRAEFLKRRRHFLGSSDAAAICNLSPWSTPLHVWLAKTGQLPDIDSKPMEWGRKLEDVVAAAYSEETGREVASPKEKTILHPEYPFLGASLDRVTDDDRILECKTSSQSQEWGTPGTDEVPEHYIVQVQHQLACTGKNVADIAVLINGSDFRVFTVERNNRLIDHLLLIESNFWLKVINRQEPHPEWTHPATPELLKHLWGVEESLRVQLLDHVIPIVREYVDLGEKIHELETARKIARAKIEHQMGLAGHAKLSNGLEIIRRKVERGGYTVAPTTYTLLRVRHGKEFDDGK